MTQTKSVRLETADLAYIALFAVLIAVCAWISIPLMVPFTLQTFGVFCAAGLLGGKRGTLSVLVYIVLGAAGIPVFSGFTGGIGILLGATGGYIMGFACSPALYWLITRLLGNSTLAITLAMVSGLLACYLFGTAWFMTVYAGTAGPVSLGTALGWCVFPFLVPDLIKIALAAWMVKRLARFIKK